MKTKFDSFTNIGFCKGCKLCVKGLKSVVFLGGKCSRSCWYCSLSESRKKCKKPYVNEREIKRTKDLIEEIYESNSKGVGITGGDPLVYFKRTINYAKALKKEFGKNFHIHIYLPLNLVNRKKLEILKKYIDEVRFHPTISKKVREDEIEKIKIASEIFGTRNTGIEVPMIPDFKNQIYELIKKLDDFIGFANLNEFEISETNFKIVIKKYRLNNDTYTINKSKEAGKSIIEKAKKERLKVKLHLCTAKTKDLHQYRNRLLKHNIMPYGKRLKDGNVTYFCIYFKNREKTKKELEKVTKNYYLDEKNKRFIVKMSDVAKIYYKTNLKISKSIEQPTFGNERVEYSVIGKD